MNREEVIWVYKIFLGREPESEDVIAFRINSEQSQLEMIMDILKSEEFSNLHTVC